MGRKPNKIPPQTTEDKLKYTKGQITGLKREIKLLKERVRTLETQFIKLIPKEPKQEDFKEKGYHSKSEMRRIELLKKFHPDHREDDNE